MRVIIPTDLEGISGVVVFEQTRDRGALYEEARRLLMGDVNATVEGCLEAGATDVVVRDDHGGGFNFVPELMHRGARYLTGAGRPRPSETPEVYEGFDAAILLGYHAKQGTRDGLLHHTQSSVGGNRYWYNGLESGEIAQTALMLGHFGTKVVMVAGDTQTCDETNAFLGPAVTTVSTKVGISQQYGFLDAPAAVHDRLREGARSAVSQAASCAIYTTDLPIHGRLQFPDVTRADAFRPRLAQRVDDTAYEAEFSTALHVYDF
ncbi:MAG: aminopeptidase [Gemmatimonadetes bacterium]|jgi:D-amino peptidase|nr:aminopeptidase [Gemmatimonadota bacterium]MBT6144739.1 aminopeptidase [Gemmatimonadota bacterium]MBT7861692.1 aminopeptidase [Gemmatimonadota bacterium]